MNLPQIHRICYDGRYMKKDKRMPLRILYEDRAIIVIDKPSGMLSVSYEGNNAKTALDTLISMQRRRGSYSSSLRPAAVHRLDKDTSGVMIFALNAQAKTLLMNNWQTAVIERSYRAVCANSCKNAKEMRVGLEGVIDAPLAYNAQHIAFVPKKDPSFNAHRAVTRYKVLARNGRFTLFELKLETGRKNQIRAHLSYIGYPVCGDSLYCAKHYLAQDKAQNPFGRLALHARTISFRHPFTEETLSFTSEEPENWHLLFSQ